MKDEEKLEEAAAEEAAEKTEDKKDKKEKRDLEDELQPVKNLEACIEAVLFAAGYPVPYQKLAEVTGLGVREVKRLTERIMKTYQNDKHGIMVLMFDKTCQLCTKEQYGTYIREALGIRRGGNLSASSMEVLAIVAYNQPVTRAFVDAVRGMDSSYAVNSLIDKELIVSVGRLDAPGRPLLYGTTDKFLRVFGLKTLEDLPQTETILPPSGEDGQLSIAVENENGDPTEESAEEAAAAPSEGEAPAAATEGEAAPTEGETPTEAAQQVAEATEEESEDQEKAEETDL
ncbi:MAG: SMC-Scp complex subunit ScpB [Clostridia bacterium]|nr:SMC-Scp complex subunit ScpB [Clostridia bacterium]